MHHHEKDHENCVKVNIFVKCKDGSWKKEKEAPCVTVNIHVDCQECEKHSRNHPCK